MAIAKLFTDEHSQVVRIPHEYRFDVDEVFINKIGDALIITPVNKLADAFDQGVKMLSDDFLSDSIPDSLPSDN